MMLTPKETHISVMLNELQALCYSRAMQNNPCMVSADQIDDYKRQIMAKIIELRQTNEGYGPNRKINTLTGA